ncbi:hypothetical protein HKX23_02225 [Sulfitobacter sp. KE29]|uniref:DUF6749 family protein n=1 Tax=unclassified Sulfitobacter TaxID=196795 RepID=UPI0007C2F1C7|nr:MULTISPECIES: DUF6749 family protein [unclassified Sulfitobacter]KZY51071.1 hypothetical protein A3734_05995 [Sulfitobacter sp. HI0054]MBO9437657.1 hypothetical protein [Sulfitobacter sp. R18_2]MDF3417160.1 hypothetical protein [Sulfitobacter sp. Ks38]MDF3424642.1 hypothetical protein [Sulfitobacter sp. KE29]MDF3428222.1 hypothetical protein [Sulfitobacter sp. S46]
MTAILASDFAPVTAPQTEDNPMALGAGVGLFTTGLNRGGGDMLLGEGVEMFTTGLQQDSSITQGGGVGLFTTGLAPAEGLPFSG